MFFLSHRCRYGIMRLKPQGIESAVLSFMNVCGDKAKIKRGDNSAFRVFCQ